MTTNIQRLIAKYPDKVPIVIERAKGADKSLPDLPNKKFLVPRDLTIAQFLYTIRKRIELEPSRAIYLFFDNTLPSSSITLNELYEKYKNKDDDVLYGSYTSECTFG